MPNSASDARHSEFRIRKKLIEEGVVDVVTAIASQFFYTVKLPVTLRFLNKSKRNSENRNKVLFIDAREIYNQIDRSHREFTQKQIEFISNIVRLYRGVGIETVRCSSKLVKKNFPDLKYRNIKGLCKAATIAEIRSHNYSVNPGRYVGSKRTDELDRNRFSQKMHQFYEEYKSLRTQSEERQTELDNNMRRIPENLD